MVKKSLFVGICILILVINTITYAADSELTLDTSDSGSGFTVKDSIGEPVMSARGDGNVGIGTTSPTEKLEIGGTPGVDGIKFPDGTTQKTAATGGIPFIIESGEVIVNASQNYTVTFSQPFTSAPIVVFGSSNDSGWVESVAVILPSGRPTTTGFTFAFVETKTALFSRGRAYWMAIGN